tara:strand:- start:3339 stop:5723 length:2385 start_codon:yes stop_codon:yes gene_type:complete
MKNKFIIFFLLFLFISDNTLADQFKFETSKIEFLNNGDLVKAEDGKAIDLKNDLEVEAKVFNYEKNLDLLKAIDGVAHYKSDEIKIFFDEIILDQKKQITKATNNIKIVDLKKKISIETDSISYDKNNNVIESLSYSKIVDANNNSLKSDTFIYDLKNGVLKLKNASLKDVNDNIFNIEIAYYDTINDELIGKDILLNLNNKTFNDQNDPRIKGRSIIYKDRFTEISNGIFTTCKITDKCPPWQLTAKKISHDSKKQIINYDNALLKVYNVPVMYFPKFFHPDPTVKRKSGFLIPSIKNSPNSNSYFSLPYYTVLSQNKDITFTPRFFSDDKFLLQTEYRQANKDSNHETDFSFFDENQDNTKTHFFYKYNRIFDFAYFDDSKFNFKIEKTSNDTYLRANKLISPLIKDYNTLENTLGLDLYSENLSISSEIKVFEDLDKTSNDRYEFILPKINLIKKFENPANLDGNFFIKSNNFIRSYATNILEKININDFIFNSNPKISKLGFYNNYDMIIKNVNSDSTNSNEYKENENFFISGIFQYNSSFPLVKEKNNSLSIFKPKMSLKLSPMYTKDMSDKDGNRLDVNNIFNIDRLSSNNSIEGGSSVAFGGDYTIFDENKSREVFEIKFANNFRFEKNDDLPKNNQIGEKTSNFFSEFSFSPNENFTSKYSTSTRNNLTDINYENLNIEISLNNFITTFDYLNENNTSDKNSYLTNTTKYSLNKTNSISFSTRENKSSNLTEYYNLIYEYKNDCLAASVEYNKDYYDDRDIKPEENLFLKLTIIPFGETSSPNLKD